MLPKSTLCDGGASGDEEEGLVLAALQRSPTCDRARTAVYRNAAGELALVDVGRISSDEQKQVLEKLIAAVEEDVEGFFRRVRQRFDAYEFLEFVFYYESKEFLNYASHVFVNLPELVWCLEFPKVEVRFKNLKVDALVHVGSRALPTIPNFIFDMTEAFLRQLRIFSGGRRKLLILNNINGIIRPSRLTLLLGPPSSGKTTFLWLLQVALHQVWQMSGKVTYNGQSLEEFTPQRTSAYASQQDLHIAEMTVREVLEFAGSCQGAGFKNEILMELLRREKIAEINPDQELDIFIKVCLLLGSSFGATDKRTCGIHHEGDEMLKGISGGQKKRLTTAELLMGPSRVLLLDEISTGLDSSTTHQIINYLRHTTHALGGTTLVSLLQPDPETYKMFDDVILFSEGQIVYQGPCEVAIDFFTFMGFKCPSRKNVADFLQEVLSEKDQEQYWFKNKQYTYVTAAKFVDGFQSFHVGNLLAQELAVTFDKNCSHPAALSTKTYGISRRKLLRISLSWQVLLLKRNSPVFIFKLIQLLLIILMMMSVFFRTTLHHNTLDDGGIYLGALYFAIVMILFNGFMEVPMLIAKLPVLYKQRDLYFYPLTYYAIGFDPQITRCIFQFLLYFTLHQMSIGLFRVMASLGRNMVVANTFGSFAMLVVMVLGGFILSRDSIPVWWIWGYWFSPMMYAQSAASVNEFLGHSWDKKDLTKELMERSNNLINCCAALGNQQAVISKENCHDRVKGKESRRSIFSFGEFLQRSHSFTGPRKSFESHIMTFGEFLQHSHSYTGKSNEKQKGMVLPFKPLSMCFSNISYYVDVPLELKGQGLQEEKLQLLVNVTGAFRPGVLTALVGVSGAGKTTLMDVLAGRKTGGHIEGRVYISGYPKNQKTFARISGYCEQNDVHSPCLTVRESLVYSAWLRLSSQCDFATQRAFVDEVMELVELTQLRGALVGVPGVDGLSVEQRKRLTIAVELVANPSIVFMDEPTSGLDARSAAIVMRAVRNIVDTGRTIVCTIHQPSIDIFESFDELLLMKRGGRLIYAGPLGEKSIKLIEHFEAIPGVKKIRPGYNPAAWILEVTSPAEENRLGLDFAELYRQSDLYKQNKILVESLSKPDKDTTELNFPSKYSLSYFGQFLACLWKQNLSYWRNPQYTAVRFFYTVIISLMFGTICWKFGSKRETQQDISNAMGSMYAAVLFIGITNATSVQPVPRHGLLPCPSSDIINSSSLTNTRAVVQVAVEFPYVCVQSLIYSSIFYLMASFEWNMWKFLWYIFFMYFTLLYFTFFGMMTISITPNQNAAAIVAAPFYMMWNLFSGFMVPYMRIPIWWRWYYWANPIGWSLYGLLTSQYGDMSDPVTLSDGVTTLPVKQLLKDQFGFRHDFLSLAAFVVAGLCTIFAFTFALAIKHFNFQRR
ncbi:hypothetical protein SASPL_151020 [Salvia splendens]|uniref:ABC transporter domain-containing protein n=1 Tax=Salvia splendens TaxID=180675 RepID=A0A8X8Z374_SALSN|nr:hypothetical protein SASPL_151020 [Salvia splendens]